MADSQLLNFIENISGDEYLRVEEDYGQGFVKLRSAEAERRQAKHDIRCVEDIVIEMLRNSRDADSTNIFIASNREGDMRSLTFIDDGCGIPPELHETIFEPRVTSKLDTVHMDEWGIHGRGMALYAIKSNADLAKVASSNTNLGSAITVHVDLSQLVERTDQSTLPSLEKDEEGTVVVSRGPHNIARNTVEFALVHKRDLDVYLGSPAEIAATLYDFGEKNLSDDVALFCDDINSLQVTLRLAACGDAAEFMDYCNNMGLSISERTAHRILNHQIPPLRSILNTVTPQHTPQKPNIYKDNRGLKLSQEDLDYLSRETEKIFERISDRYYLSLKESPKIKVGKDSIRITIEVDKDI